MNINDDDLEIHAWPPRQVGGQQVGRMHGGILVIHRPTGIGVCVIDERSQIKNKIAALEKLKALLSAPTPPRLDVVEMAREHLAKYDDDHPDLGGFGDVVAIADALAEEIIRVAESSK